MTQAPLSPPERTGPENGDAPARSASLLWLFVRLLAIVAVAELGVMWVLGHLTLTGWAENIADACLLSALVAMPVWWTLGAPLDRARSALHDTRGVLHRVESEHQELMALIDESAILAVADPSGAITFVNDNFCRVTGYSREELIGRDHRILNSGHHPPEFWSEMHTTLAAGKPWHGEVCNRTKAGDTCWMDTIISATLGPDRTPRRYLSMRVDITERKRAEQSMRSLVEASEAGSGQEFLRIVARSLASTLRTRHVIIGEIDPERRSRVRTVAVWSDGAPAPGFTYELAGTPCEHVVSSRDVCLFTHAVQERFPVDEMLIDMGVHCYVGAPLYDTNGQPIGILAALDDRERPDLDGTTALLTLYSERVAAELRRIRLEDQVQRLSRAVESAADVVVLTDPGGTIEYVNPSFTRVTGYSPAEAIGNNPRMLKSGAQDAEYYRAMWATLLSGSVWSGRAVNRRKDGSHYHASINISPLVDERGEITGYVGVQRDVTQHVEQERVLSEARAAAESASRAKSEFLANMSHEIRTPMNGVLGMTQLLLGTGLTGEQHDYAITVRRSAEALLAILNDILDFSKIEAGKLTIENAPFEWAEAVEEVVELLAKRAEEKSLALVVGWECDLPRRVVGDAGRLRQIVMNLAGNAIKFTEHGRVAIHVGREHSAEGRAVLRVSVSDTGIGFSSEQRDRLFQRFEQADGSTTRRFGGTGLGLAISRQLVGMMGGTMGCDSVEGEGSTFWFTVDLEVADPSPAIGEAGVSLRGAHVLLAHGDRVQRAALRTLLRARGAAVLEAATAAEALEAADHAGARVDLVAVEHTLAETDGGGWLAHLRARPAVAHARMLLLSPVGARMDLPRLEREGFSGWLAQPLRPRLFLRAAERLVRAPRDVEPMPILTRQALLESHDAPAPARATAEFEGARVLVAEDHPVNQRVASGLLRRLGCEVEVANDGLQAAVRCAAGRFDAVFMDCQMPVMDGYDSTRRIREDEAASGRPRVPVIALTASALVGDREQCLAAGMDDFLTKPVKAEDLRTALTRWTRTSGDTGDPEAEARDAA
ncbi:MAG: PAS domain S-box protein [Candidatus Eisenbacteria bacterium]|uniref:Sensory/regulatory protein RpfC n=1 Tax=Eiseniibacteriota bacterium TaxID=2212470 RepID=A0A933SI09_UNCEI|nr:PAS domain S-box protein [Candidatus Eisenbacteria bacterium]